MDFADVVIRDAIHNREAVVFNGQRHGVVTGSFTSTGRFFLAGEARRPSLWEIASAQRVLTCGRSEEYVSNAAVSPSGHQALSFSALHMNQNKLWDLSRGEAIKEFKFPRDYFGGYDILHFSPDGKRAISLDDKHTLTHWDLAKDENPRILAGPFPIVSRVFPPPMIFVPREKKLSIVRSALTVPRIISISLAEQSVLLLLASDHGLMRLSSDAKWLVKRRTSDLRALIDLESGQSCLDDPSDSAQRIHIVPGFLTGRFLGPFSWIKYSVMEPQGQETRGKPRRAQRASAIGCFLSRWKTRTFSG